MLGLFSNLPDMCESGGKTFYALLRLRSTE